MSAITHYVQVQADHGAWVDHLALWDCTSDAQARERAAKHHCQFPERRHRIIRHEEEVMQLGTKVVAKHPVQRGAWWGTVTAVDGDRVAVLFDLEAAYAPQQGKTAQPHWLPAAIVLSPEMPASYLDDGVGEYYWRKDQEVQAERAAFQHDPANKGKVHWPETYID